MANADSNKAALRWALEDDGAAEGVRVWGDLSTDAGYGASTAFTNLRYTGESLKYDKKTIRSNEIRGDRNVIDHIEVSDDVSGDINAELSYATFDTWFKLLLSPDGAAAADGTNPMATTIAGVTYTAATLAVTDTTTITDSANAFITQGFVKGQWIKLSAWTDPANAGYFKILTIAAGSMTVTPTTLAAEVAGAGHTMKGRMMRNGTGLLLGVAPAIKASMIIEKHFSDLTTIFQHFTGLRINQLVLSFAAAQIVTCVWSLMGKNALITAAQLDSGAITAANTNTIMNCTSNMGTFTEGGSSFTTAIKNLSITIKNNLRNQDAIGSKFPIEQGIGWFEVEGKMEVYFQNATFYNKLLNHTSTSFSFRLTDASSNVYIVTIPAIRLLKGEPLVTGGNADVMLPVDFAGYIESTYTPHQFQLDIL